MNTLNLNGGAILNLKGAGSNLDLIHVTGPGMLSLDLFGQTTVNVADLGGLAPGTYHFLKYKGSALDITGLLAPGTYPPTFTGMTLGQSSDPTYQYIDLTLAGSGMGPGSGKWMNTAGDHLWATPGNWVTGQPLAAGHEATFDDSGMATTTTPVDLGAAGQTIGKLLLGTTTGGYTIGASSAQTLTLDNTGNPLGGAAAVAASSGTHTLKAQLVTALTNLDVGVSGGAGLNLSGGIANTGEKTVTLSQAGAGTLRSATSPTAAPANSTWPPTARSAWARSAGPARPPWRPAPASRPTRSCRTR